MLISVSEFVLEPSNVLVLRKKPAEKQTKRAQDVAMEEISDSGSVKTKQIRFCFDFTALNPHLLPCPAYPLPTVWEILSKLSNAKWCCAIDMANGYFGVP